MPFLVRGRLICWYFLILTVCCILYYNAISRFESIMRDFPEWKIVISSGWREKFDLNALRGFFSEDIARRVVGITPVIGLPIPYWRQREIEQYLFDMNQPSIPWVVIDDMSRDFETGLFNLVTCNPELGLDEHAGTVLRTKLASMCRECSH
jgi:hypothetical protein